MVTPSTTFPRYIVWSMVTSYDVIKWWTLNWNTTDIIMRTVSVAFYLVGRKCVCVRIGSEMESRLKHFASIEAITARVCTLLPPLKMNERWWLLYIIIILDEKKKESAYTKCFLIISKTNLLTLLYQECFLNDNFKFFGHFDRMFWLFFFW